MKILQPLWSLLLFGQVSLAQTTFTKPSEAYEFADRPVTESEVALHAKMLPAGSIAPSSLVRKRARALCPSFRLEGVSGEELYWLAKLCEEDPAKALPAVERYLALGELAHGPDARLVLAVQQMRTSGSWEAAWGTFRTILQEDPMGPAESQIDGAIDQEAGANPDRALEWSKERYAILLDRKHTEKPGVPPVHSSWVLSAGSDLVHRYYLAGEAGEAVKVLSDLNHYVESHSDEAESWGAQELHWANMEMHPAPAVTILRVLGGKYGPDLIQQGRVEVVSFFFLGCAPCIFELPRLNDLQKRYGGKKLLVADVTTYKANSYLTPSSHSNIEASLKKARLANAPNIEFVITSDETLASYGVRAFPVVAIVDKMGRVRYVGLEINFRDDDSTGRLIQRLIEE